MDANQLRIGNLTRDKLNKTTYEINVRSLLYIIECEEASKEISIEPIPMDEKWLLKFGFDNINLKYHGNDEIIGLYLENIDSYLTFDNNEWRLEQDDDWRDGGNHHDLPNIEFVHQFQNLYFALTGKELTLKD